MKRTTLLLLWLLTICFSAIRSDALTIPASEDSYTAAGNKLSLATNNANSLVVDAGRKSYLYFDLSDIPKGAVVRWAKLRLFLPVVQRAGNGLSVHVVTSEWNESRLSNLPTISTGNIGIIPADKMASRRFVTVDVTSTVQSWISGGTLNEGFAIQPIVKAGSLTASAVLTSKEGPVLGLPAELDIDFQPEAGLNKPITLDQLPGEMRALLNAQPPVLTQESQLPQSVRNLLGSLSGAFTPKITTHPDLAQGSQLFATAENNLDPQMKYQWIRNGVPISTGTESSLRRAGLAGGTYQLRVRNTVSGTNSVSVVIPDNGHEVVFVPNTGVMFSKYETTLGQWKAFVEETGWNADTRWKNAGVNQSDDHPVVYVTSNHAQTYCEWLSSKTAKKWRLPSNEEWSLAVGNSKYPWGDSWPPSSSAGNYNFTQSGESDWRGNPSSGSQWEGGGIDGFVTTAPVGSFAGNFNGIFDLGGNVAEWTKSLTNPTLRGASWGPHTQQDLYTETIGIPIEVDTDAFRGFRVVCEIPELIKVSGGTLPASSLLGSVPVDTFYIGRTEVTWKEWVTVRDWAVEHGYNDLAGVGQGVGDNYPVRQVNWFDVVKWCNARSEKEGKTPVYKVDGAVYKIGQVTPTEVASANGYRLPTEKEWEFAARGGTQTQGYTYSGSNDLNAVGWYEGNSGSAVHEVGKKLANELGIYDMSGNSDEWGGSWYPGYEGVYRVIRGGEWADLAEGCSVAYRDSYGYPGNRYYGFRVALNYVPEGMVIIPAGEFQMGDALDGDSNAPVHAVTVSAFYIGETELTYGEWKKVKVWATAHGYSFENSGFGITDEHPADQINWYNAVKWCNAKSEMEGLAPAYYQDEARAQVFREGQFNLTNSMVDWNCNGYRLPTEAEWERAARGGLSGMRFPWGNTISQTQANYNSDASDSYDISTTRSNHPLYFKVGERTCTNPVKAFTANGYGLYGVTGNSWEWCWDWFGDYGAGAQVDPKGSQNGSTRVARGGSFYNSGRVCRVSYRYDDYSPDGSGIDSGFRLVRRINP